jgi:ATP-binding cassette subfamily E protein 1
VVEHDLATLDFMADRVHIFYGEPGVFGVASKPYIVKKGINSFLNGYVAEDNMKIREKTVFEEVEPGRAKKKATLTSFENIHKSYDGFDLKIKEGELYKHEALGVFGPNALGKTTFAKILAGEIPFTGSISDKIRISYKPQYISSDFEGKVSEMLGKVNDDIILKLGLDKLMEKIVKNLSGGELQRVAIALCLSKEADLYLLDEPSAFLDVDQRLVVAKLIKSSGKTAAVIDHDLLFLSYVAERAMLFSGIPGKRGSAEFLQLKDGFNKFLKSIDVTFRRDEETKRPRANKLNSVKDREQKEKGEYFF